MALTVIQTCNINSGSTFTSASVGFPSGNTPGNLLVAGWRVTAGSPAITVTDSAGNTWNTITQSASGVCGMAWAPCTFAAAANVVTWHTPSAGFPRVIFAEVTYGSTGVTTWTQPSASGAAIGATTTPNSGTISDLTTDLLIGVAANQTDGTNLSTTWTTIYNMNTWDPTLAYHAATGSDAFFGTSGSASWGIAIANFRPTITSGGTKASQQIFF